MKLTGQASPRQGIQGRCTVFACYALSDLLATGLQTILAVVLNRLTKVQDKVQIASVTATVWCQLMFGY